MRPSTVPSRPMSTAMLASDQRIWTRFFSSGVTSTRVSSIDWAMAISPLCMRCRPALATWATGAVVAEQSLIARSTLLASTSLRICSRKALAFTLLLPRKKISRSTIRASTMTDTPRLTYIIDPPFSMNSANACISASASTRARPVCCYPREAGTEAVTRMVVFRRDERCYAARYLNEALGSVKVRAALSVGDRFRGSLMRESGAIELS